MRRASKSASFLAESSAAAHTKPTPVPVEHNPILFNDPDIGDLL
jgi:hypothetical protein